MRRGFRVLALISMVSLLLVAARSRAQAPDTTAAAASPGAAATEARPSLRAKTLPAKAELGLLLDGRLDEPEWADAPSIADLVQFEPDEGVPPANRTEFKVLASPTGLVIGFRCLEDTAKIVAFSKARDVELDEEDHVLIVLDTFGDERSGFVFAVNALGSRFDGLITSSGDDVNSSWDALWEAAVARDATGWSGEIRIPIQSLNFKQGLTRWGLNVERRFQNAQESSRSSGPKRDFEIFQMIVAGYLTDLPAFDQGMGLTVRPALVGRYFMPDPGEDREFEFDPGLDVTQKLGTNLVGNLTVNTDFAETEVDQRQTNLSRFDILFPEKRSFFLEGADIFEFGLGTDLEDANVLPFYSRRIGLFTPEGEDEGTEVPIRVGGKVQGRVSQTNLGALAVSTSEVEDIAVPKTGTAVLRVRQNVFANSSAGIIATAGDPLGRPSWTAGADFTFLTSTFQGDKNFQAGGWWLQTGRDDLGDDRTAYGFKVAYPNDIWAAEARWMRIGDDFDPSLGFVQRTGNVFFGSLLAGPRPENPPIRQYFIGGSYFQSSPIDEPWESYNGVVT